MIGYKRSNNTVGIRNYTVIMSAADNVNPLARKISKEIKQSIYSGILWKRAAWIRS